MKLAIMDDGGVYTPRFRSNQNLPKNEQIQVHWRLMTNREQARCSYWQNPTASVDADGKVLMNTDLEMITDRDGIIRASLEKLTGCSWQDVDGKEHELVTADDLIDAPAQLFRDLYEELATFFLQQNQVTDDTKKK